MQRHRPLFSNATKAVIVAMVCGLIGPRTVGAEPEGLLLTWQRDPTTTMTVQWLDRGVELPLVEGMTETGAPLDIPAIGPVPLDGSADSWWDRGLAVEFLADGAHGRYPAEAFEARLRVAWNDEGLLLAVRVTDQTPHESDDITQLWSADALEIFVSEAVGSRNGYQVVIAPGADPRHTEPRHHFHRTVDGPDVDDMTVRYARQLRDGGYAMEVLLPWENLPDIEVRNGTELGFQIYATDHTDDNRLRHVAWYPVLNAPFNPDTRVGLRLAEQASSPVLGRGETVRTDTGGDVIAYAHPERAGRTVSLWAGDRRLTSATLALRDNTAQAAVPLPEPPTGRRWGNLEWRLDDHLLAVVPAPLWAAYRAPEPARLRYWPADDESEAATVDMQVIWRSASPSATPLS